MDEKDYLRDIFNNVNPKHEVIGSNFLENFFLKSVSQPVLLHVEAKRYLARDPIYYKNLSQASKDSLKVQGGTLNDSELKEFLDFEFSKDAIELRKLDDIGKDLDAQTPDFDYFSKYIIQSFK
jgi:predicted HD phosphohydrolase